MTRGLDATVAHDEQLALARERAENRTGRPAAG